MLTSCRLHTPKFVLGTACRPKLPPVTMGMTRDYRRMVRNLLGHKIVANVFKRFTHKRIAV